MSLEDLETKVANESKTGDPDSILQDWLSHGDLDGMTVDDVVEEWDADRE